MNKARILFILITILTVINTYGQEKPVFSELPNDPGPGMARFEGVIRKIMNGDTICGKFYNVSMLLEVQKVNSVGRNLLNRLSTDQSVILVIESTMESEMKTREITVVEGQRVSVMVREKICQQPYQSAYMALKLDMI